MRRRLRKRPKKRAVMLRKSSGNCHEKVGCSKVGNNGEDVRRYTREEMLGMKNASLSQTRPQYLSTEFDNEEGKFSPEKWIEYHWVSEGVENRSTSNVKRKEKLKAEALEGDTTVLSPQRRGFSSGCRAASPPKSEAETERLGANKASWRSGAGFQLKNSGTEYKTSFHKNSVGSVEPSFIRARIQNGNLPSSTGSWRSIDTAFKPNYQKESGQNQRGKPTGITVEEKIPEWLNDGPTSMHDMIELRGFDDDGDFGQKPKNDSVKAMQQMETASKNGPNEDEEKNTNSTGWRHSSHIGSSDLHVSSAGKSVPSRAQSSDDDVSTSLNQPFALADDANSLSSLPLLNGKLPNSDAEFAAIMGILGDADLDTLKENELKSPATNEPTGSRLSRFFATTAKAENSDPTSFASRNEPLQQKFGAVPSSSVFDSSPAAASTSVLDKIFSNTSQRSLHSPFLRESHLAPSVQGVLRVEDLERNFQKESIHRNVSALQPGIDSVGNLMSAEQIPSNSRQSYSSLQMSKGNPLGDPHQQAHLMSKLSKFARLQDRITDDVPRSAEDNLAHTSKIPSVAPQQLPGIPLNSQIASHPLPPAVSDMTLQAAILRSQYEKAAALQALAASQQRSALAPQNAPAVDNSVLRHALTNMMQPPRPLGVAATSAQSRLPVTPTLPNAFMPTSVMRQMTKNNNTSASVEEKLRNSNMPSSSAQYTSVKPNMIHEHLNAQHKLPGDAVVGGIASKNAADLMTRLALQQQYAQMLAAMQNGLSLSNWQPNTQIAAAVRAQTLAAQAEQQRQFALAVMRGDLNQAQIIRARFLSQQAAAFAGLPNVPVAPHPHPIAPPFAPIQPVVTSAAPVPQNTQPPAASAPYKYQNPLEKLLQSAGVPANKGIQPSNKEPSQGSAPRTTASDLPSIVSRLPPTANCISVEELEKQFAAN